MLRSEPIFETIPGAPSSHASTIVALPDGRLLAAWFAGTHEKHPDVAIWLSRCDGGQWETPVRIADVPDVPLWNPVLFLDDEGVVWLFYKIGPEIPAWTGAYIRSVDGGETWSAPIFLPAGLLGPAKNKPILLSNGDILCGSSRETWHSWACWVEIIHRDRASWSLYGPLVAPGHDGSGDDVISAEWDAAKGEVRLPQEHRGVIQPTVWEYAPGRLKMLMRSTRAVGFICSATSDDYGRTWSEVSLTEIPHSNSGLDAVRLVDGRIILACNPTHEGRTPLSLLMSEDNGETWPWRKDIETGAGEYSYPSIVQGPDGRVHLVYTYRRQHIRHLAFSPDDLMTR
ncbi:MAG: exo-alpha-sialidase [Anaerolineae bacterium]|nr:exo-alpha-sialidase [Anaerolineae bacterium]